MPNYSYKCPNKHITHKFSTIALYQPSVNCPECGELAQRHITQAPMGFVQANFAPYDCPITGKIIDGRRAHEENLSRHECRILEPGERENVTRRRQAEDAAFDAAVEKTAEEFVEKLSGEKREQLGRELESGADISVSRQ